MQNFWNFIDDSVKKFSNTQAEPLTQEASEETGTTGKTSKRVTKSIPTKVVQGSTKKESKLTEAAGRVTELGNWLNITNILPTRETKITKDESKETEGAQEPTTSSDATSPFNPNNQPESTPEELPFCQRVIKEITLLRCIKLNIVILSIGFVILAVTMKNTYNNKAFISEHLHLHFDPVVEETRSLQQFAYTVEKEYQSIRDEFVEVTNRMSNFREEMASLKKLLPEIPKGTSGSQNKSNKTETKSQNETKKVTRASGNKISSKSGWTVFQRNSNLNILFDKTWEEFKRGFGSLEDNNYWLGFDRMVSGIKNTCQLKIIIELAANQTQHVIYYRKFQLFEETSGFKIIVGGALKKGGLVGRKQPQDGANLTFSTKDQDNDLWNGNCALKQGNLNVGWWYDGKNNCGMTNLNLPVGKMRWDGELLKYSSMEYKC